MGCGHSAFYDRHLSTVYVLKMDIDAVVETRRGVENVEGFHFDEDEETGDVTCCQAE